MKKRYNKLIRDRIPKIIEADDCTCKYHEADDKEFEVKLHEKLIEEINEFLKKPSPEEMADILEVLEALRKHHKISLDEVRYHKESKKVNRGVFDKKLILEWTKN